MQDLLEAVVDLGAPAQRLAEGGGADRGDHEPVSYTHLRAHETVLDLVCRLLLEKKKQNNVHETEHFTDRVRERRLDVTTL